MVKHWILAVGLMAGASACEKKEAPTPAERAEARSAVTEKANAEAAKDRAEADVKAAKAAEDRAEHRLDKAEDRVDKIAKDVDIDKNWKGPDDSWKADWVAFADGRDRTVERGDYIIERDSSGGIVAWRKVKQVAGEAAGEVKDATLAAAVKAKLAADDDTRAYAFDVDADDHVVTLRGHAKSSHEAAEAVRLALSTPGTEKVISHISWK